MKNFKNIKNGIIAVAVMGLLAGCSSLGVATGVGVAVGTAAVQEGGLSRAASDIALKAQINDLWFRNNFEIFRKVDMTVKQGRVLLTGVVQDPEHRVEAVRLAWQPQRTVQVINEIKVADSAGIVGFAKDKWISGRLRTSLIADKRVESINYSIDTVQGVIYLMGFAQDQSELNHVIDIARRTKNVKQVVSYVKISGTPVLQDKQQQDYVAPAAADETYNNAAREWDGEATQSRTAGRKTIGDPVDLQNMESVY